MSGKKLQKRHCISWFRMAPFAGIAAAPLAFGDPVNWKNVDATDFNAGSSWATETAPGEADIATFADAAIAQPQLSSGITVSGVNFTATAAGYNLTAADASVLTLLSTSTTSGNTALTGAHTAGSNTITAGLFLGAAAGTTQTFTQAAGGTLVLNGQISGGDSTSFLNYANTGIYAINNANTYTSTTQQTSGSTLIVGNAAAFGTGTLRFNSSSGKIQAGVDLTGVNKITNDVIWAANATINASSFAMEFGGAWSLNNTTRQINNNNATGVIISGVISGDAGGGLSFGGSGTTSLTAGNLWTGNTSINGGTIVVTTIGDGGAAGNLGQGSQINMSAGTLRYSGAGESSNRVLNLTGNAGVSTQGATGPLTLTGGVTSSSASAKTLTISGDGSGYITGNVVENSTVNTTGLSKSGTGTWVLSGVNSFSGSVAFSAGQLGVGASGALGTGTINWSNGGSGQIFATQDVTIGNGMGFATAGSTTATIGVINGNHSITVNGNIAGGTNSGSTGTKQLINDIVSGETLTLNGTYSQTGSGSAGTQFRIGGTGDTIWNGIIQGGGIGRITYAGSGSLTLNGLNNHTNVMTLSGPGTVNLNTATALGSGTITLGGSVINNTSGAAVVLTSPQTISITTDTTFYKNVSTPLNNLTFSGNLDPNGSRKLTINGSGTTLSFDGTFAGADSSRTLTVAGAGNTLSLNNVNIGSGSNNRTLTITGDANVLVEGTIANGSGNSSIVYSGTGILTLAGPNTYTGSTNAFGGTVRITGTQAGGATNVNGATLAATGTLGSVTATLASGSLVTPTGATTGTTVLSTGNFTLRDNSLAIDLGKAAERAGQAALAGDDYDRVNVTGAVVITDANLVLNAPLTAGLENGDLYFIIVNDGVENVTGTFNRLNGNLTTLADGSNFFTPGGMEFQISYFGNAEAETPSFIDGNDVVLKVVGVPEPASLGLIALAAGGLLGRRKRRHG